jgi:hypothetical protein
MILMRILSWQMIATHVTRALGTEFLCAHLASPRWALSQPEFALARPPARMSVAAAPTMMYSPMGSPRIHAASGQMSSPRAMSTRLPSMSPRSRGVNGGSSSARLGSLSARSLSGPSGRLLITPRLEQTPRHQADFGSPLGGALPTNPLVSLTLSMDGAVVTRLLIELRHDDSPNTCRPARSRLMGLCGTKLAYTGRLGGTLVTTDPTAVGPSTSVETVQADSPPKLGHWGRGVLSAKADGTLAILLDPKHADLREYRPIGQVLRGYEGLEYIETMSQVRQRQRRLCSVSLSLSLSLCLSLSLSLSLSLAAWPTLADV